MSAIDRLKKILKSKWTLGIKPFDVGNVTVENPNELHARTNRSEYEPIELKIVKRKFGPDEHKNYEIRIGIWGTEEVPYKACRANRHMTIISKREGGSEDLWRCVGFWIFWKWMRVNCANGRSKLGAKKLGRRVTLPLGFTYTLTHDFAIGCDVTGELVKMMADSVNESRND